MFFFFFFTLTNKTNLVVVRMVEGSSVLIAVQRADEWLGVLRDAAEAAKYNPKLYLSYMKLLRRWPPLDCLT